MSNIDEKAKNNFTIDKIDRENRIFGYWFPPYKKYIPHRLMVLRLALKDLERIKEILFCSMNARDVLFSGFLCVVSWYALNVCVGKIFVCVQGFSRQCP